MKDGILKVLLLIALTAGAFYAGNKYLTIHLINPFGEPPPPVDTSNVLTVQQIPVEDEPVTEAQMPVSEPEQQPKRQPTLEEARVRMVDYLKTEGAQVLDSKAFENKAACDSAVKSVAGEYRRRGIPETDMVEREPFPGTTGSVMMFRNGSYLYYLACITPDNLPWAVYVHFMPNAVSPTSN